MSKRQKNSKTLVYLRTPSLAIKAERNFMVSFSFVIYEQPENRYLHIFYT